MNALRKKLVDFLVGKKTLILVLGSIVTMWADWLASQGLNASPPVLDTPEAIVTTVGGLVVLTVRASIDRWTTEMCNNK